MCERMQLTTFSNRETRINRGAFSYAVVYADDVPATVAFYRRVIGLEPTYYDADLGFAVFGEDQAVAVASHDAGMLMLADGYGHARSNQVRGTELAFWTRDVAAAFQVAVEAGATALTPPRVMPWVRQSLTCRHLKVRSSAL